MVDNPKYAFDRRRLPPFYAQAYPLMQDRFPQLLALRNIAFKYGFFFEDLIKPIKGEDLTRYAVENSVPKPPLPFPRIDSDKRDICRFNYVGMDGKQYFEKENDGYIYVYLDALSADEEEYKNQIETIPGKIKSARNVKRSVYGNIRSATMQICLKKTFEKNRSKISSGFVGLQ